MEAAAAAVAAGYATAVDDGAGSGVKLSKAQAKALKGKFIEIFWGNVLLAPSQQKALAERHGFEVLQQFVPPPSLISVMIARRPGG